MNEAEDHDSDVEILEPDKLEDEWLKNEILLGTELLKCRKPIPASWAEFKERSGPDKVKTIKSSLSEKSHRVTHLFPPSNLQILTQEMFGKPLCNQLADSSAMYEDKDIMKTKSFKISNKGEDEMENSTLCNDSHLNVFQTSEQPVPQLGLSADGKVVISDGILDIKQSSFTKNSDVKYVKNNNHKKKERFGKQYIWTHEETLMFYKALHSVGSDFELMKTYLPGRSRRSLKCKFKKEERVHGTLIDKVLIQPSKCSHLEVLQELDEEYKLEKAKASCGRNMQVKKQAKKYVHDTITTKYRHSDEFSAKELKALLNSEER